MTERRRAPPASDLRSPPARSRRRPRTHPPRPRRLSTFSRSNLPGPLSRPARAASRESLHFWRRYHHDRPKEVQSSREPRVETPDPARPEEAADARRNRGGGPRTLRAAGVQGDDGVADRRGGGRRREHVLPPLPDEGGPRLRGAPSRGRRPDRVPREAE